VRYEFFIGEQTSTAVRHPGLEGYSDPRLSARGPVRTQMARGRHGRPSRHTAMTKPRAHAAGNGPRSIEAALTGTSPINWPPTRLGPSALRDKAGKGPGGDTGTDRITDAARLSPAGCWRAGVGSGQGRDDATMNIDRRLFLEPLPHGLSGAGQSKGSSATCGPNTGFVDVVSAATSASSTVPVRGGPAPSRESSPHAGSSTSSATAGQPHADGPVDRDPRRGRRPLKGGTNGATRSHSSVPDRVRGTPSARTFAGLGVAAGT